MEDPFRFLEREYPKPRASIAELERDIAEGDAPVSRALGRLLSVLVHCMQANRVLEIGTGYGYATLWMALALPPAGRIWTFDPDIERTEVARTYFERAGAAERIEIINQPALEVLPIFPQRNMDIVFIDPFSSSRAGSNYAAYVEHSLPLLKLSGLIVVNRLPGSAEEGFIKRFLNHPQLDATIVPLPTGIGIGARKQ